MTNISMILQGSADEYRLILTVLRAAHRLPSGSFTTHMLAVHEVFDREKLWFRSTFVWRYVVLDEGHKNEYEKTNISMVLRGLAAEYRLILTVLSAAHRLPFAPSQHIYWPYTRSSIERSCGSAAPLCGATWTWTM